VGLIVVESGPLPRNGVAAVYVHTQSLTLETRSKNRKGTTDDADDADEAEPSEAA